MPSLPVEFVDAMKQAILNTREDVEDTDSDDVKEGMARMVWSVSSVMANYDNQFDYQQFLQECNLE